MGGCRARSRWGSSLSVRAGARPAAEREEGGGGGRWERGCETVAGREEGLGRRRDAVGPWHAAPPAARRQECNGSISLGELIPSSAQAQLCGCPRGVGRELGRGGAIRWERAQGRRVWGGCDDHCRAGWGREGVGPGGGGREQAANSGLWFCPRGAGVLVPRLGSAPGCSLAAGETRPLQGWLGDTFQRGVWGTEGKEKERSPMSWQHRWREGQCPGPKIHGAGG